MNSKNQTRILAEANFGFHHASKLELSVKYFNWFNNNTIVTVNKTVTESDEILEIEIGNSSPRSNSKQKREAHTEPLTSKKKFLLTRDYTVNVISEKGLSVNQKVKTVNFPGCTSKMILEKLDAIIKEKQGDLMVHAGTNDITYNVNLSTNIKKIFNKTSKESPLTSIAFSSIINRKDKTNIQKTLTDANAHLKYFCMQKEIGFIDNKGI